MDDILEKIIESHPDESFLKADGFDAAIIGIDAKSMRLIYSVTKCIDILMIDIPDDVDAIDYFEFNVSGAYMGEKTPIWCYDDF